MTLMTSCKRIIDNFRREDRGSVTVEFALFMPVLFWAYAGAYVFFDGYRQSSMNMKAAYTIGDLISRETQIITPGYIDAMYDLTRVLTKTDSPMNMRITVIRWDEEDDQYYLDWSQARGTVAALEQADLTSIENKLPVMPDEERVILVETWNTWEGVVPTGLGSKSLDNFIFTRPRFAPQVVFENPDP